MKATLFSLFQLATLASAAAVSPLEPRQQATLCKQYEYWSGNGYEMNNNLWGKDSANQGGSQCTYLDSASSSGIAWHSTWNWQGNPNNVKSYVYAGRQVTKGKKISQISSMPTSVSWKYSTSVRANVAYDIFTASDPDHSNSSGDYELMIWLGRLGDVYPIGKSTGSVNVGGKQWDLWIGMNGAMKVFSFISPQQTNQWSGDAKQFFTYLQNSQGFPASSQNLIVYQFGTEAFTGGPATFTVSQWSASVN